jgi:hypothetical protein
MMMIGDVVRTAAAFALSAAVVGGYLASGGGHRPLDPNEPIAADGSMISGRAHTIFDTEPTLDAYGAPRSDSDDPADFEPAIKNDRGWAETDRSLFKGLLARKLDWSACAPNTHVMLLLAVRTYYGMRGREKHVYAVRGPRAKAAIEREWSTPADEDIDDYVRHALQYGILHKSDVPKDTYDEFGKTFADTQELGAGCAIADKK